MTSFVCSEMRVNKPQTVRRTIRTRIMRNVEEKEIKKELGEIGEMIKGELSIDEAIGMYSDRVKVLFNRFFSRGREKCNRHNLKWFGSEANLLRRTI